MVDCWSSETCWTCCYLHDMALIRTSISNIANNPQLWIPDHVVKNISAPECATSGGLGYQNYLVIAMSRARWGDFCTPPSPSPFPSISTDPKVIDTVYPTSQSGTFELSKGNAIACRFIPTFVCIPYIVLHDVVNLLSGTKTVIEIREEDPDTHLPKGTLVDPDTTLPDNNIIARTTITISPRTLADAGGGHSIWIENFNVAIPINAILNNFDVPHWLVMYSEDFVCSNAYLGSANPIYKRVKFPTTTIGSGNFATFTQSGPSCGWAIDPSIPNLSFSTYKTASCHGVIIIDDFGFAIDNQYVIDNCFKSITEVKNKNVIIGIKYTSPRSIRRLRFDIVYRRPNGTYYSNSREVTNTSYGSNEVFIDTTEKYISGVELEYKELSIGYEVLQV